MLPLLLLSLVKSLHTMIRGLSSQGLSSWPTFHEATPDLGSCYPEQNSGMKIALLGPSDVHLSGKGNGDKKIIID